MIAVDTSTWIAFLSGESGDDVDALDLALEQKQAALPPVVLSELLSDAKLPRLLGRLLQELPLLSLQEGYWQRTGRLRAKVLAAGNRARLADSLIAQACIDHHMILIARDRDFRHFVKWGLKCIP